MTYRLHKDFERPNGPGLAVAAGDRLLMPTVGPIEIVNRDERIVRACITTADQDRDGDVVVPTGCKPHLKSYNGAVLWFHDQSLIPPASNIGLDIQASRITATARLSKTQKLACDIWDAIVEGRLKGVSISFRPLKWSAIEKREVLGDQRRHGYRIEEWELLEWSFVAIPANPNAGVLPLGKSAQQYGRLMCKVLGMSEGSGAEGGFMADEQAKKESADKAFCRTMKKAVDDHEGVMENAEVKKFHGSVKKLGGRHFSKAYPDEDWGWKDQEDDAEGKEGDEAEADADPETEKRYKVLSDQYYALTGVRI